MFVSTELAAALRRINARYNLVPIDLRDGIDIGGAEWSKLELRVDRALAAGHDAEARAAITAWEGHALREIEATWSPESERELIDAHEGTLES